MLASASGRAALSDYRKTIACNLSWHEMMRLNQRFQLIVLSDVCHLFDEEALLADMLIDSLLPGGRLLIRHVCVDRLHTHSWYEGFPRALAIDRCRSKRVGRLLKYLQASGLRMVERSILDESKFYEPRQWIGRLATRCYSTLRILSEYEVSEGLAVQSKLHSSGFRSVDDRDVVVLEKSLR